MFLLTLYELSNGLFDLRKHIHHFFLHKADTKGIEKPEFDSTLKNKSLSYNDAETYRNPERLRKYESLCSMRASIP
jgi:hypothetical protein